MAWEVIQLLNRFGAIGAQPGILVAGVEALRRALSWAREGINLSVAGIRAECSLETLCDGGW